MPSNLENKIDRILEKERDQFSSSLESFDMYKERTKAKYLKNLNDYKSSVQRGYKLIIEQISNKMK